ncbi:MAG: HPP family protein [Deltaproteobacteria bacterium]|nr:HPP family protein [Deltaproteobacteria bacterium]
MLKKRESLKPVAGADRYARRRFGFKEELLLVILPTLTVLAVLFFVEILNRQRLLFSSLASSSFLIYLDPMHGTNAVRSLVLSHLCAALLGLLMYQILGPGYISGGVAMVAAILLMILLDAVHPPAVSTSLIFAFRVADESNLILFALALGVTAALVLIERSTMWLLARHSK